MRTVLIADDSSTARMVIQRCLELVGMRDCRFLEAVNGQEALDLVRKENVDLLVTDLNMPIMDGKRLVRAVKASPRLNIIPIIVVSSLGNPGLAKELLDMGVEKVVFKPLTPDRLRQAVEPFLPKEGGN